MGDNLLQVIVLMFKMSDLKQYMETLNSDYSIYNLNCSPH